MYTPAAEIFPCKEEYKPAMTAGSGGFIRSYIKTSQIFFIFLILGLLNILASVDLKFLFGNWIFDLSIEIKLQDKFVNIRLFGWK